MYCYSPEEDPYDGEEGAIWSFNYFFFNKARKRVCYIYLRGLSIISHSPVQRTPVAPKRSANGEWSRGIISGGAIKRARYWLGDRADGDVSGWGEDEDDGQDDIAAWGDDEVDVLGVIDDGDEPSQMLSAGEVITPSTGPSRSSSAPRGISEDIADSMEV